MDRFKMINNFFYILLTCVFITAAALCVINCSNKEQIKKTVIERDTIFIEVVDSSLAAQNLILYNQIDSLENIINVYDEELTIALIKLERIEDYNAIAAKGNNIKYLRGWINRVLKD